MNFTPSPARITCQPPSCTRRWWWWQRGTSSGPGCDRPINWTSPHHIEFWSRGGLVHGVVNHLDQRVRRCLGVRASSEC